MVDIESLEPAKPFGAVTEHRPTGATYRMLLKAVLEAISHDSFDVAIVVPNHAVAMHCLEMLKPIVTPLRDFASIRYTRELATFQNSSEIRFHMPEQDYRGLRVNLLLVDESYYNHMPKDSTGERWEAWLKGLRDIENRYGVQTPLDTKGPA